MVFCAGELCVFIAHVQCAESDRVAAGITKDPYHAGAVHDPMGNIVLQ